MRLTFLPGESLADYDRRRIALYRAERLEKAAALIEERGWHQGGYRQGRRQDGAVCAEAAIRLDGGTDMRWDAPTWDLIVDLQHRLGDFTLPYWNDRLCTTTEQVTGQFRTWAGELRREAGQ